MNGAQFVDDVQRVQSSIVGDNPRDDLQRLGEHVHHELLLARNGDRVVLEAPRQLHLSCSSTGHHSVGLEAATHDHDRIVQGSLRLLDELLGSTTQDDGCRFGLNILGDTLGQSSKRL